MRVLVTGARGMLGSALVKKLATNNQHETIGWTRDDVDLRNKPLVENKIFELKPDLVIHAAAVVGGIQANISQPVKFLVDNLLIDTSVMMGALNSGVSNLLYIGSSCMYPKNFRQPLVEQDILGAPLETTNEGYALAKISGSKLADSISVENSVNYKTIIPSNLYGPGDDFSPASSHLVAATIRKTLEAKKNKFPTINVWGDGSARREFTYIEDLADWVISNLNLIHTLPPRLNLGAGIDYSINDYYRVAMDVCEYNVPLDFDLSKPVGMKVKLMDSTLAREKFRWAPATDLRTGMLKTLEAYLLDARMNS